MQLPWFAGTNLGKDRKHGSQGCVTKTHNHGGGSDNKQALVLNNEPGKAHCSLLDTCSLYGRANVPGSQCSQNEPIAHSCSLAVIKANSVEQMTYNLDLLPLAEVHESGFLVEGVCYATRLCLERTAVYHLREDSQRS